VVPSVAGVGGVESDHRRQAVGGIDDLVELGEQSLGVDVAGG
jgi:hypothetical protein